MKIRLTAPPIDGAANEALVAFLAKAWRIPKRDLSLVQGFKSRHKVIFLPYEMDRVRKLIEKALGAVFSGRK